MAEGRIGQSMLVVPDGTDLVNNAFMGINIGSLPQLAAITRTTTTTVQAPNLSLSKSDDRLAVEPGEQLTYTLRITRAGKLILTK